MSQDNRTPKTRPGSGLALVVLAYPLAVVLSLALVAMAGWSFWAAIPVYLVAVVAITLGLALFRARPAKAGPAESGKDYPEYRAETQPR